MQVQSPAVPGFTYGYTGPNQAQVDADNTKAIADGMSGGFSMADILTDNDKKLTGWTPAGTINQAAIALANYRWSGAIQGEATPQFVSALQASIAKTGSYPANPASLMGAAPSAPGGMTPDTFSALLSIVNGTRPDAG